MFILFLFIGVYNYIKHIYFEFIYLYKIYISRVINSYLLFIIYYLLFIILYRKLEEFLSHLQGFIIFYKRIYRNLEEFRGI